MKVENEIKINVHFEELNHFIFNIDNLPKWLNYIDALEHITMNQEIKGSYILMNINIFKKPISFNFRISEYEKNKKIRIKANLPFLFEITIKTFQSIDGNCYVKLKTKCKPNSILFLFRRKKLKRNNNISLENLEEYFRLFNFKN